jgi:3-dehydroquinate synthase
MIDFSKTSLLEIIQDIKRKYGDDLIIITDSNVYEKYFYYSFEKIITFNAGEDNKNIGTVMNIYDKLLEYRANKNTLLVGVGGGITTDITGYIATTFMRGLKFGFVSTTLLGMVDAAIGGKNGVNFNNYKNIVGTINEPEFIYVSNFFLDTLPDREFHAAFGEILKYAIGFDESLFEGLEKDTISGQEMIKTCAHIKENVVYEDLDETKQIRKKLNLGHTIAHASEKTTHKYVHGECVWIGLYIMNWISYFNSFISKEQFHRINNLLNKYKVVNINTDELITLLRDSIDAIKHDKKFVNQSYIDVVLINGIGSCTIKKMDYHNLIENINRAISLIPA